MTPKEKAEDLVNKFLPFANDDYYNEHSNAKKCALIAVDELQLQASNQRFGNHLAMQYWLDVEKEIERL